MPEEKKNKPVPNYTGNSHKQKAAQEPAAEERVKIDAVITGKVVQRKRGFWRRMTETMTGDDVRSVGTYVVWDIAIPALKDLVFDIIKSGAERSLYGDTRPRSSRESRERSGRVAYDKKFMGREDPRERREISPRARRTHDFGDIILESRVEVERVLDGLTDLIEQYEVATISDLYELLDTTSEASFVDNQWGWTNLSSARATRVRSGWLLDLPKPEPID